MTDVNALVDKAKVDKQARECWAVVLTGRAAEYRDAVRDYLDAGGKLNFSEVHRTFRDEFGVEIGDNAVRLHFKNHAKESCNGIK